MKKLSFSSSSLFADQVLQSAELTAKLMTTLAQRRGDVEAYFQAHPSAPDHTFRAWSIDGDGIDFADQPGYDWVGLRPYAKRDLYLAVGGAKFAGTITVNVKNDASPVMPPLSP